MKIAHGFAFAALAALIGAPTASAQNSAVGLWKSIEPNKTVLIRTYEEGGKLKGKVEKLVKNGVEDVNGKCVKCTGDLKDKPLTGLVIIWDMQKDGEKWTGGKILEPDSGKIYNCKLETAEGGKKLNVRGSIAFLGKTQTWVRTE